MVNGIVCDRSVFYCAVFKNAIHAEYMFYKFKIGIVICNVTEGNDKGQ